MVADLKLSADDRFDSGFTRGLREMRGSVEVALIGQRHGGQVVLLCQVNDALDREGRVQERIDAVDVEWHITRGANRRKL